MAEAPSRAARARALADSDISSTKAAAAAHGCKPSDLHAWRRSLSTDPELDRLYRAHARRLADQWKSPIAALAAAAATRLREAIEQDELTPAELERAIKTCGELLVTSEALHVDPEDTDANPRDTASAAEDPRDPGPVH